MSARGCGQCGSYRSAPVTAAALGRRATAAEEMKSCSGECQLLPFDFRSPRSSVVALAAASRRHAGGKRVLVGCEVI